MSCIRFFKTIAPIITPNIIIRRWPSGMLRNNSKMLPTTPGASPKSSWAPTNPSSTGTNRATLTPLNTPVKKLTITVAAIQNRLVLAISSRSWVPGEIVIVCKNGASPMTPLPGLVQYQYLYYFSCPLSDKSPSFSPEGLAGRATGEMRSPLNLSWIHQYCSIFLKVLGAFWTALAASPHIFGVGKILPGFASPLALMASVTQPMVSRSVSENI